MPGGVVQKWVNNNVQAFQFGLLRCYGWMGALMIIPWDDKWDFLPTKARGYIQVLLDERVEQWANSWGPSMGTFLPVSAPPWKNLAVEQQKHFS